MVGAAEAEAGLQFAAADIAGKKKKGQSGSSMVLRPWSMVQLFFLQPCIYRQKALP